MMAAVSTAMGVGLHIWLIYIRAAYYFTNEIEPGATGIGSNIEPIIIFYYT